jgi:hypothetical protein
MPRVLQQDTIYPWVAVLLVATIIADGLLIWSMF